MKRIFSLILSITLVISIFACLNVSASAYQSVYAGSDTEVYVAAGQVVRYSFTPSYTDVYTIDSAGLYDTYVSIYNSSGTVILEDDDSGADKNFRGHCVFAAGVTYTIEVRLVSSSESGTFSLSINRGYYQYIDAEEPDSSFTVTYTPILSGNYTFFSAGDFDTKGGIYDQNGTQLQVDDDGGTDSNFCIQIYLSAGKTYHFVSQFYNEYTTGSYGFFISGYSGCTHSDITIGIDDAECLKSGKSYFICNSCGETFNIASQTATGHNYAKRIIKPTCTEQGYTKYTCTNWNCSSVYYDDYTNAKGHSMTSTVTKKATCTKTGTRQYKCKNCSYSYKKTIAKKAHTFKNSVTKKATFSANGKLKKTCTVCKKVEYATIYKLKSVSLSSTSYTANGKTKKPSVTVKNSVGKVVSDKYYTVTYPSGRKNVGKYDVSVTFKSSYSGSAKRSFTIKPPATSISSVTPGSNSFTLKWSKVSYIGAYQIQYAENSSFTASPVYISGIGTSTTSKKVSGLKKGKTYYVRIRTYKNAIYKGDEFSVVSDWSPTRVVTVK